MVRIISDSRVVISDFNRGNTEGMNEDSSGLLFEL